MARADPPDQATARLEMCNGVAWWYSPGGALAIEAVARSMADLGLSAVRAQQEGRAISLDDLETPPTSVLVAIVESALRSRERPGGLRVEAS